MKYVLDTNIVVRLLSGDPRVLDRLKNVDPADIGIPLVVLAELWFGAEKSTRREENQARIQRLTEYFKVPVPGPAIAKRYAIVRADVERRGRRKSDFDLLIACTALEHAATLVTNDGALKDGDIPALVVEDWIAAS